MNLLPPQGLSTASIGAVDDHTVALAAFEEYEEETRMDHTNLKTNAGQVGYSTS